MALPNSLRTHNQWLVSGNDKAPRSVKTGRYADARDPTLFVSYEEALAYAAPRSFDVGFALTSDDPFAVIDLDDSVDDPATEAQKQRHAKIYNAFDTYAELSRSGTGVHIWCLGSVPRGARRDHVEVYSSSRYMICTGRVVKDRPITDQNHLLQLLYSEITRGKATGTNDLEEQPALQTDNDVLHMALNAANTEKFEMLCRGEWEDSYPSQSEADFALMNMFCFYSKSNEQCRRMFRMSALGKRDKAHRDKYLDYMIGKIRAEEPEPIDFSYLRTNGRVGIPNETPPVSQPPLEKVLLASVQSGITYPPGLVGAVAQYIYDSSTRPVAEVGITAAIAMCAGILGRQFNISNTGLNQYVILIAQTGVGKDGASAGIERILHEVRKTVPAVDAFVGPGTFASGQAVIRTLDEKACFFSVMGEFGLTLQQLSDPSAAGHTIVMRRVLLDLYGKSGKGSVIYSSSYSDKEKNTKTLFGPAMTIFGESTPDSFFAGLSQQHIADGLIPRFLIVEYLGSRPDRNTKAFVPPPEELVQRVAGIAETALRMMNNRSFVDIQVGAEATAVLAAFDRECDKRIRDGESEAIKQLWNRAHLKALRLAGLLAAADRGSGGVGGGVGGVVEVNGEEASWSIDLVWRDLEALSERFERGDIGEGLSKQMVDIRRVLRQFVERSPKELEGYGVTQLHKENLVVPHVYVLRRLANVSSFKKDRRGTTNAIKDALQQLIDSEVIKVVPKVQMKTMFNGSDAKLYHIVGDLK